MRNTTRRRVLAACGGTIVAGTAGCLGGDEAETGGSSGGSTGGGDTGGETGGSSGGSDGAGAQGESDEIQIVGERVLSEEITGSTHWDYDLAEGDTVTVVMESDGEWQSMGGHIVKRPKREGGRLAKASGQDREVFQYTSEEASTYRVIAGTGEDETMTVEIFIREN